MPEFGRQRFFRRAFHSYNKLFARNVWRLRKGMEFAPLKTCPPSRRIVLYISRRRYRRPISSNFSSDLINSLTWIENGPSRRDQSRGSMGVREIIRPVNLHKGKCRVVNFSDEVATKEITVFFFLEKKIQLNGRKLRKESLFFENYFIFFFVTLRETLSQFFRCKDFKE